jgi:hypothetical protein
MTTAELLLLLICSSRSSSAHRQQAALLQLLSYPLSYKQCGSSSKQSRQHVQQQKREWSF